MRGQLDIGQSAELYRKYKMLESRTSQIDRSECYLFECEDRLDKLKEYYNSDDFTIKDINDVSDYFTYVLEINNKVESNNIIVSCVSKEDCEIDELAEILCNKIFDISDLDYINYEIDETKIIIEVR